MSDGNFDTPGDLRYTEDHEWARLEGGSVVVGITDYAQDQLGDVTYVELPDVGAELAEKDAFGVVESVKTFSDLYAPIAGTVTEVNEAAADDPSLLNSSPYGDGWLVKIELESADAFDALMSAEDYAKHLESIG